MRFKYPELETAVETRCASGHAQVLRCYPLRWPPEHPGRPGHVEPFPTLFWLACSNLARELSLLESAGRMQDILSDLADDPDFRTRLARDHDAYLRERWESLAPDDRALLERSGRAATLRETGIGGMRNFAAVKCLHLHYAHHLARGNAIGRWLDERALVQPCAADSATAKNPGR